MLLLIQTVRIDVTISELNVVSFTLFESIIFTIIQSQLVVCVVTIRYEYLCSDKRLRHLV